MRPEGEPANVVACPHDSHTVVCRNSCCRPHGTSGRAIGDLARRGAGESGRRHFREVVGGDARVCGRCRRRRQARVGQGLRHGRSRARRAQHAGHDLRGRIGVEAIHRRWRCCCWRSEGKLSIDDPVRKYIPELPDYRVPLTIRHMLNHTSGLRDWGSVESIAGWPRTTRDYTHAHVLDIVSRQKSLNFTPGTHYSYSNTGYNLAAIIVSRVSGMPFAEFEQKRIFTPLGMTHTSWRDDTPASSRAAPSPIKRRTDGIPHRDAVRERLRQRRPADDGRRSAEVE